MKTNTWLRIVRAASTYTATEIAEVADMSPSTVRRYLPEMVKRGVLRKAGGGRAAVYTATPEAREAAESFDIDKLDPALGC